MDDLPGGSRWPVTCVIHSKYTLQVCLNLKWKWREEKKVKDDIAMNPNRSGSHPLKKTSVNNSLNIFFWPFHTCFLIGHPSCVTPSLHFMNMTKAALILYLLSPRGPTVLL